MERVVEMVALWVVVSVAAGVLWTVWRLWRNRAR